jgi:hypothetical protein
LCVRSLLHRNRFARDHRLVDRRSAFEDGTVDGNALTWSDSQALSDMDFAQRHVSFRTISLNPPRCLRRKTQQVPNRAARSAARSELQHLTEQDEDYDDGGRLEVNRDLAHDAERIREYPGS